MRDSTLLTLTFIFAGAVLAAFGWLILQVDAETIRWLVLILLCTFALGAVAVDGWLTGKRDAQALDKLLHSNRDLTDHVLAFKNPYAADEVNAMRRHRAQAEELEDPTKLMDTEARILGLGIDEMTG